jgi:hypothetical protein
VVGVLSVLGAVACSSRAPSTAARACQARDEMQSTLNNLRSFDYTHTDLTRLRTQLDSLRSPLKQIEGAVHLPQQQRLNQLGGVGHIRQVESNLQAFVQGLSGPNVNVGTLESTVRFRTNEVQQIVDAIAGC